jgi:hypothetical protein
MGETHIPFALSSVETLERQNDALTGLQPLENGASEQFARTFLDLAFGDPAG